MKFSYLLYSTALAGAVMTAAHADIASTLWGMGVQSAIRGTRLYDTPRVRDMVKSKVDWYKKYRAILDSDLVHGRRADGRDLDWMMHVNPTLKQKGMLVVWNPLDRAVSKTLSVNLYYTGLTDTAFIREGEGATKRYPISRDYHAQIPVTVPANGMAWYVIEE